MAHYYIVLAEDHREFRRLLRQEIELGEDLKIIGEAEDGKELLELLEEVKPDLVILDISMPGLGGMEAAQLIKKKHPNVKILFLTMHKKKAYVQQARLLGAAGYVLKEEMDQSLLPAICQIRAGKTYISPIVDNCPPGHLE
jgi:DNA-binding NarL/FixJ family response regulator|uniref:Response regulator transcription factor n=1 Tax=Desulfobacca acetoxidans TaxID=60893 RepID=A0A7V6DPQ1_9BACT